VECAEEAKSADDGDQIVDEEALTVVEEVQIVEEDVDVGELWVQKVVLEAVEMLVDEGEVVVPFLYSIQGCIHFRYG
jgi:hypothetical protein